MKYSKIEMDENGRAIVCPRCGNKEPFPAGGHCVICNAPTENTCLGHIPDSPYLDIEERSGPCSESKKSICLGMQDTAHFAALPPLFRKRNFYDLGKKNSRKKCGGQIPSSLFRLQTIKGRPPLLLSG